jgi:large subunit ribosomal protein L16
MLQPNRRKYRKEQKGRNTGVATRGANVSFGDFGLKATERGRLTARQIEAARRAISRHIKRGGRIFIRIFPDKPVSQKPAEVRMGNGKGNPEYWVAEIVPAKSAPKGTVMKASELRAKDIPALEKEVVELQRAHFGLRMQRATQQLNNHSQLGKTRRDIARAKTILAQKRKEAAK